jgi:type I restriction enzyme S subunit
MQNESLVPELRFPEFEYEWKNNILGSLAAFSKGKGISKSDIDDEGNVECIRYGELYTEYGEVIDKIKSKTSLDINGLVLSQANDVIIPASGETQIDIATASCVLKSDIALGGDLNIIKSNIDGVFLSYYLNSARKKDIARLSQGISVVHLYASQLKTLKINLPNPEEQQKIASFLSVVDKRIKLLEENKIKLEQYKKGVLQQLFNQDFRFKDDDGNDFPDWEEKKLGEICTKQSSNISANTIEHDDGDYKIYGASGYLQNVDFYREEEAYISIVKDGAGVGRILLCEPKSSVLGTLEIIKPKDDNNLGFLFALLSQIRFTRYITGSTIPHIYFKDYSKEKVNIPHPNEQKKIADMLSSIEKSIDAITLQIDRTIDYKKGLLQKMFV